MKVGGRSMGDEVRELLDAPLFNFDMASWRCAAAQYPDRGT